MPGTFESFGGYRAAPGHAGSDVVAWLHWFADGLLTLQPETKVYFFSCLIVYALSRIVRRRRRWSRARALEAQVEAEARHDLDTLRARRVRLTYQMGTDPRLGREGGHWGDGGRI